MLHPLKTALLITSCCLSGLASAEEANLNQDQRINYSLGYQIGTDLLKQKLDFRPDQVSDGMRDGYTEQTPRVDPVLMQRALVALKKDITDELKQEAVERVETRRKNAQQQRQESADFLAQKRSDPNVVLLDSGVQYKILKQGQGPSPKADDQISFNYVAKTMTGQVFDTSKKHGKPVSTRADQVIPGIAAAIQKMTPGSRWEVYVPPDMAFGRKGPLANQAIVFELELVEIKNDQ